MKIKLAENLPEALVGALAALGHDVDNVRQEGIAGMDDDVVWRTTQAERRFLITQDLDCLDVRVFAPGSHEGLMLVRLRSAGRMELIQRIVAAFKNEDCNEWRRCFVVLGLHKLRIHRPVE